MQEWIKAQYVIARAYDGELLVIDAPDELKGTLEGYLCEDNYFSNLGIIPAEKGLYLVDCEIYYDDGTCYLGEAADQEWVVRCKKATMLANYKGNVYDIDNLIEKLAALEHEQWAHWTRYMLDNLTPENIQRWRRQIETPYEDLSEKEKESDRVWARKVMELMGKPTYIA
jgi:hypothetical protein